jgi:hypothetical protein
MTRQDPDIRRSTDTTLAERASVLHGTMIISDDRDCCIELSHQNSDVCVWTVRRWKKILLFKSLTSAHWFINKEQAFSYAVGMRNECIRWHGDRVAGERQQHGSAI